MSMVQTRCGSIDQYNTSTSWTSAHIATAKINVYNFDFSLLDIAMGIVPIKIQGNSFTLQG